MLPIARDRRLTEVAPKQSCGKMNAERPTLLGFRLCEQLGFALRANIGAELGLTLRGQGKEPGERVGRGERQGSGRQEMPLPVIGPRLP